MKKFLQIHTLSQREWFTWKLCPCYRFQNKVKDEDDRNGYYMQVCLWVSASCKPLYWWVELCNVLCLLRRSGRCNSLHPPGLKPARLLYPWDFPGKNTAVCSHFLLQGIFPTQEWNPCLLHWQMNSLPLNHHGSLISWLSATFKSPF